MGNMDVLMSNAIYSAWLEFPGFHRQILSAWAFDQYQVRDDKPIRLGKDMDDSCSCTCVLLYWVGDEDKPFLKHAQNWKNS